MADRDSLRGWEDKDGRMEPVGLDVERFDVYQHKGPVILKVERNDGTVIKVQLDRINLKNLIRDLLREL